MAIAPATSLQARIAASLLPAGTVLLTIGIFLIDTLSPLGMAVATLYTVVILLASRLVSRQGLQAAAWGFGALSLLSYLLAHGPHFVPGPAFTLLISLAAIGTATFLALEDRATNLMLREHARLLDQTHDTIFVRDMKNVITYWNRGAEETYGWTADEVVGKASTHSLLKTIFPASLESIEADLLKNGRWEGELVHTRADGMRILVASRWSLQRDAQGRAVAILETNNDVTEHRRATEALLKAQTDLAHVTRVSTLGELTASIAHEINQPLAAIVTNGEVSLRLLAAEAPDVAELREAVGAIISDGRRASEIIKRLRTLTAKSMAQRVTLDLNEVVREVLPLVRQQLLDQGVALRLALTPGLPSVAGDRVQLQQVVINLIINAIDAIAAGEGGPGDITVRSRRAADGQVLVAVEDSGIGIDPAAARHLFEAFFTTKPNGMGMGLSICRSIIESHGGTIRARANAEQGSVFEFGLPPMEGA